MALGAGGWLLFPVLMLLRDKEPGSQQWAQTPPSLPQSSPERPPNTRSLTSWPLSQGHSSLRKIFVSSFIAPDPFPGAGPGNWCWGSRCLLLTVELGSALSPSYHWAVTDVNGWHLGRAYVPPSPHSCPQLPPSWGCEACRS